MDHVVIGVAAGVIVTIAMDLLNYLIARYVLILKIDVETITIGRMSAGWVHGRFRYRHPAELNPVHNKVFWVYITHYGIGVALVLLYLDRISWL